MSQAARQKANVAELESGYSVTVFGEVAREWAACIKRVFEVNPVLCEKCGGAMKPVAVIGDDGGTRPNPLLGRIRVSARRQRHSF